ncbi:TetR/AcrR family transcriptional regulator [Amycolatopsis thermoflava]|uniref:TetR/AcrR family transcriptional regulator n=1 Tax=Amycolatopsis thermoflava TaxID=84480 RepID=UPI0037FA70CD
MAGRTGTRTVGTPRPRDRKAQIIAAASDLFYRFGYHNVGTGQIASAVGITAGALYRHFRSKQELLAQALIDSFEQALSNVEQRQPRNLETMVEAVARIAAGRRDLGVLWNRETRHLDDQQRDHMRGRFYSFLAAFSTELEAARDDLSADDAEMLAWCALAVMTSPSYHRTEADENTIFGLLCRMTVAVVTAPVRAVAGAPEPGAHDSPGIARTSRREAIITAATRLFRRHGYQATRMDEIGAAVGITSAAVYKYFPTKVDLLAATVARASEPLQLGLNQALASAATVQEGLDNALDGYIDFAVVHHDLLGLLVSEVMNLPDAQRHAVRRAQHDYVAELVELLRSVRPELGEQEAKFVLHAVLTVVNDVTRTRHLVQRPLVRQELRMIVRRLYAVGL